MKKTNRIQGVAKKWRVLRDEPEFETPIMTLYSRHCRQGKKQHRFYVLKGPPWCNIVPITTRGTVVLIWQYRVGTDSLSLEIPGGVVDPADRRQPKRAALRELLEETGYAPLPGARVVEVAKAHSNPAIFNNRTHSFLVGPVEKVADQALDPQESISVVEVPIDDIPRLIRMGVISHALILNTILACGMQSSLFAGCMADALGAFTLPTRRRYFRKRSNGHSPRS